MTGPSRPVGETTPAPHGADATRTAAPPSSGPSAGTTAPAADATRTGTPPSSGPAAGTTAPTSDTGSRRRSFSRDGIRAERDEPVSRGRFAAALPAVCAALLVLVQISYPLTEGAARDRVTVAVVLLSAGTALAHAAITHGMRYAAGFLVIVSGVGLVAEIVGTATGFPFGSYEYASGRIGPAVSGVPLIVALAWTGGLYPVWVAAGLLARRATARVALIACGAVGWDLYLDPQMVADGQWTWHSPLPGLPGLPEIPYTNYLGWFGVSLLMALLLIGGERLVPSRAVRPRHSAVPLAVFGWTWLGSALAHAVFLGMPASSGYGGLGMAVLGVPLVLRLRRYRAAATAVSCGTAGGRPGTM